MATAMHSPPSPILHSRELHSPSIPAPRHALDIPTRPAECCCGRKSCAYLQHNNVALEGLEKDIQTAAQLGHALLIRHEAYMAEAESSRLEMSARIEALEMDKKSLEAENARTIRENRSLLNQLEELNGSIADSEVQVKSLEATLQSTQMELRRLEGLAQRTRDLEMQLAALENEQVALQQAVSMKEEDGRTAMQRWRKAERGLIEVQAQLEKIEREAREERERHVEVVGRMERQRAVERELDGAAGRLKGAAAATSLGDDKTRNGSNVVSHFVKDILQDNANLQFGIVELREMLMSSNDEVQSLREQLMLHQPISGDGDYAGPPTLRAELAPQELRETPVVSQELHIHHHYHTPVKKEEIRRPKKKRNVIHAGLFTPPNGIQNRNQKLQMRPSAPSSAAAILSNTAITVPSPHTPTASNRWSVQSTQTTSSFAPSSAPSSPRSNYAHIFDRTFMSDQAFDSSRPTSPGSSIDPLSPVFKPYHRKRGSEHSTRSFTAPNGFHPKEVIHEEDDGDEDVEELNDLTATIQDESIMPAQDEDESHVLVDEQEEDEELLNIDEYFTSPALRRSTSHESILSISGIDIHTLRSRPSQLTITTSGPSALLRSRAFVPAVSSAYLSATAATSSMGIASAAITSSSFTTAQPTLSRYGHSSTSHLRSSVALPNVERSASRNSARSGGSAETDGSGGLGKKVGGWVFGRWGVGPSSAGGSVTGSSSGHVPGDSAIVDAPVAKPSAYRAMSALAAVQAQGEKKKGDGLLQVSGGGSGAGSGTTKGKMATQRAVSMPISRAIVDVPKVRVDPPPQSPPEMKIGGTAPESATSAAVDMVKSTIFEPATQDTEDSMTPKAPLTPSTPVNTTPSIETPKTAILHKSAPAPIQHPAIPVAPVSAVQHNHTENDITISAPVAIPTTPIKQTTHSRSSSSSHPRSIAAASSEPAADPVKAYFENLGRSPGVNQPGPIKGWAARRTERAPSRVVADGVDLVGLREGLGE